MALVGEHLVGRAEELGTLDQVLGELDRGLSSGRSSSSESRGSARPGCSELAGARRRAGTSSLPARPRSSSATCRSRSSWTRSTSTRRDSSRRSGRVGRRRPTELAQVFPAFSGLATRARGALQHERYRSHRAVRALLEQLAATQPSSWCSTTSTGPTRRRSSFSARCCAGRRAHRPPSCWPCGPASCRSACLPRWSERTARDAARSSSAR